MNFKLLRRQFITFVSVLVVLWLMSFVYTEVIAQSGAFAKILSQDVLLMGIGLYLLFFMCLLVMRYIVMILFSFLEHVSDMQKPPIEFTENYLSDDTLPLITLIVPAFNEGKVIQPALRGLLNVDYPHCEVLVVDDGSTDDTFELACAVARTSTKVAMRVIRKTNGGKADALNTGIAMARGEFVFCMDGDTVLSPNTLRYMVRHFDDPRVGAVAGNVKILNRENVLTRIQALEYLEGLALARRAQSFMRAVNIIPGPCGMFRKSVIRSLGAYDSDTFAEDCDLTLKLLSHGWHIAYEPMAIAAVETPSKLLDLVKQRYRWTRGILQALRKYQDTLWNPRRDGVVSTFMLWYMVFEAIVWPASNLLGNVFFCYVGLNYGVAIFIVYWWFQLTLLDLIAASYCVIMEREDPALIPFAALFRLSYILIIDVTKFFATIEEIKGSKMTWGKLEREGKLG